MTREKTIVLAAAALSILCLAAARVTPEDLSKCQEATGWSKERCQVELTR